MASSVTRSVPADAPRWASVVDFPKKRSSWSRVRCPTCLFVDCVVSLSAFSRIYVAEIVSHQSTSRLGAQVFLRNEEPPSLNSRVYAMMPPTSLIAATASRQMMRCMSHQSSVRSTRTIRPRTLKRRYRRQGSEKGPAGMVATLRDWRRTRIDSLLTTPVKNRLFQRNSGRDSMNSGMPRPVRRSIEAHCFGSVHVEHGLAAPATMPALPRPFS